MLFVWLLLLIVAVLVVVGVGRMSAEAMIDFDTLSDETDKWAFFILFVGVFGAAASLVLFIIEAITLYSNN
jgi:hypothetical protein